MFISAQFLLGPLLSLKSKEKGSEVLTCRTDIISLAATTSKPELPEFLTSWRINLRNLYNRLRGKLI